MYPPNPIFCGGVSFGILYFEAFLVLQSYDEEKRELCCELSFCLVTINVLRLFLWFAVLDCGIS